MNIKFQTVYPITDTIISGLSIPEQVEHLIAGGAELIQLREKKASAREFYEAAADAVDLARKHDVMIIINDRVDIAMMLGADGVHLGQEDLSPVHARRLLGRDAIIGYSTHTIAQATAAVDLPIDYLAFGPIFPTSTKENPDPVVGLALLSEAKKIAGCLPLVAIGGIGENSLRSVLDAGADSAAMIGGVLSDPDGITSKLRFLLTL